MEFNVLLEEQTSRGKAAVGLDRGKLRSILHSFGMTSDVLMHGGTQDEPSLFYTSSSPLVFTNSVTL